MSLSGWCPPDVPHAAAHKVCQMRQDDGLLGPCGCTMHGGHEKPTVDRDSRRSAIGSETKRGSDRANESDPLATVSIRPKGA